jgi:hypothetical protein
MSTLATSVPFRARKVEDDFWGLAGDFLGDDAVGVKELAGDVGKNGRAARGDSTFGDLGEEAGEEEVDGGSVGEVGGLGRRSEERSSASLGGGTDLA